ncbi:Lpg1974 family pore-forming outer membrane protein [Mariniblastus sp.]|nr:Lpg1974 family pore-forming outer membrane protein [Mariniblastus sp.]MDB4368256.1 Lpg1974 family pore-forming outer membrane protein [Mariniblastus sp.]MDC0294184.1 Lpg1974 family pore-forming outer membrane protein [Mariniblastus sp.]
MAIIQIRNLELNVLAKFSVVIMAVLSLALGGSSHAQQTAATTASFGGNSLNPRAPMRANSGSEGNYLESRVMELEQQIKALQISTAAYDNQSSAQSSSGFYAGAAAVWSKPHFKEAFEYSETNTATGQQTLHPFQYDYKVTPKIWVGFKNAEGMGIKATYWSFDADGAVRDNTSNGITLFGAHAVTVIFPANIMSFVPGDTLQTSSNLQAQITNLYASYSTNAHDIEINGGVGLRYARLRQTLAATVTGTVPASLNWERAYDGVGPSVALDLKKRIGCRGLSAIAKGSGALLYGTKTIDRTVFGDISSPPASPFLMLDEADEVVGIGEFGFGMEWARTMGSGAELAVTGTYDGQLWAEAGAPTLGFLGFQGFGLGVELRR